MSGVLAASCCCTSKLWYAEKCPSFFSNYCCDPGCDNAPERIEFCETYLVSLGIPVPPDPTKCYYIAYQCCIYILKASETSVCPDPESPWPVNVGYLYFIGNRLPPPNEDPCCFPLPSEHVPVGGIGNILVQGYPAVGVPQAPCEDTIAECYNFYDQAGTVVGKEVTVSSTIKACVDQFGIDWSTRCDHGPPKTVVPMEHGITHKISLTCACCLETNGQCTERGPCIEFCPNERNQRFFSYINCESDPNCIPDGDCCGSESPCETDPTSCDGTYNPLTTYDVKTCYSVTNCNDDHEQDVLRLVFPCCFATNQGVDCTDEEQITELFVNNVVKVVDEIVHTGWGDFTVPQVQVCEYAVNVFSGNAAHIAQRINARIGALVRATGIGPWSAFFWFGFRQSCISCPGQGPNDRPPSSFGDGLSVDRAVYNPTNQTIEVYLRASSPRWYICVTQAKKADYDCLGNDNWIRTAAISVLGQVVPYTLHCLSFPEYSAGSRYTMRRVEETTSTTTEICTDINFFDTVPLCLPQNGFPLDDIYIYPPLSPPILIQAGWHTLCPGMLDPKTKCRCYPYVYSVAPCCPPQTDCEQWEIDHPLPQPCLRSFQDPNTYCETYASVISIT